MFVEITLTNYLATFYCYNDERSFMTSGLDIPTWWNKEMIEKLKTKTFPYEKVKQFYWRNYDPASFPKEYDPLAFTRIAYSTQP